MSCFPRERETEREMAAVRAADADAECACCLETEQEWQGGVLPPGVSYHHDAVPIETIEELEEIRESLPASSSSNNMLCSRRFLRDGALAARLRERFRSIDATIDHVLSDLRFLEYPPGGYIRKHTDGSRVDEEESERRPTDPRRSNTSFLLFLADIPEGEGGETEFLDCDGGKGDNDGETVVGWVRPRRGSLLLFPHNVVHQGAGVGLFPKRLLRGDIVSIHGAV